MPGHRRRRLRLRLPLLLVVLSAPVAAQPSAEPVARVVARHWSDVPGDTAALRELLEASWETGGATVMRGVLQAAADSRRDYEVRLHALSGLAEFMASEFGAQSLPILRAAGERGLSECRPSTSWSPGDTIRSCTHRDFAPRRSSHPRYRTSVSIQPLLRDTIRAAVQALTAGDPDPRVRSAAAALWRAIGQTERWSASTAEACRQLGAAEAGVRSTPAADPFYPYMRCEQTGPALLAHAWRTLPADSTHVVSLLRASQAVRDRRLQAALQEVAADTTRAVLPRNAALSVLAALADVRMYALDVAAGGEARCTGFWSWEQEEGGEPMGPNARQEIREFLWALAGDGEDRDPVARHAARLGRCLSELSASPLARP
jgi:hypothetical protein